MDPETGEDLWMIENRHPGVAIFDYDRDGDMDFYVTSAEIDALLPDTTGGPNRLFRNDGDHVYTEVAEEAGVDLPVANSTGVAACDIDNDGYQDLYVASYGRIGDNLDYRAARYYSELPGIIKDRLFRNLGDGTFEEITETALGAAANLRSGFSVGCSDVNNDGWIDIFVSNRVDQDFLWFNRPDHHGHYNVLYVNNGDLTFTDVTEEAGTDLRTDPDARPVWRRYRLAGSDDWRKSCPATTRTSSTPLGNTSENPQGRPSPRYSSTTMTTAMPICGSLTTAAD